MCAESISASHLSTSLMWATPPGISLTSSSRKTSGGGQQQPLVYSTHGCSHTMAATPKSHWIPLAWHPSLNAAGTSMTCTLSPVSRVSWWAGLTLGRNAHLSGHYTAGSEAGHKEWAGPKQSFCTYFCIQCWHLKVQICPEVPVPPQLLRIKASRVTVTGT